MNNVLLSVVMPVHNASLFLREAVESILNQTWEPFEFIIVDDGSTDDSLEIIEGYAKRDERIKVVRNEQNLGIAATLNKAIRISSGKYVARMDADDIAVESRFAAQVAFLDEHPEVGVLGTAMYLMDETGHVTGKRNYYGKDSEIRRCLFRFSPFAHPTVMMVREVVVKAGLYDPKLVPVEDYDLWFRIGRISKFANLRKRLLNYRVHRSGTTTKRLRAMQWGTLKIRWKAWREYGYQVGPLDFAYFVGGAFMPLLLSPRAAVRLFNWLRSKQ